MGTYFSKVRILVLLGCYRKKMNGKEEEIYDILYKKKEIDDKTPNLRTEDDKKKLKSLINKMRKFPKDLIDDIKTKFPFLQRKPKTAEQRKEQKRFIEHKRYTQATQFRAKKNQELIEKRSKESEIDKEMRLTQDKEYHSQKRSAESDIDKEMRLNKQKEYENEKRSAESQIDKEMRLNKQKK